MARPMMKRECGFPSPGDSKLTKMHIKMPCSSSQIPSRPFSSEELPSKPSPPILETGSSPMIRMPACQEITQRQLAQEITGIYRSLVQIEAKCVGLIRKEFTILRDTQSHVSHKNDAEDWQALIALHRTLLHEHHDFLLASQHPSSGPALREIATKYSIPARIWKHSIHNFLELIRRHLPLSMEFMLAFIYLAYQMMALLFETVPSYTDLWIECLGDLARYRIAIEEEDQRDREIWTGVAKTWFRNPCVDTLQHYLVVMARTHAVEQLSLNVRLVSAERPLTSMRGYFMTPIKPMLARSENLRRFSVDTWFVKVHGIFANALRWLSSLTLSSRIFLLLSLFAMPAHATTTDSSLDRLWQSSARHWMSSTAFLAITLALVSGVILGPLNRGEQGDMETSQSPSRDRWRRSWWAAWGASFLTFVLLATAWLCRSRAGSRSRIGFLPAALAYWVGMIISTLFILLTGHYATAPQPRGVIYNWIPLASSVSAWIGVMIPGSSPETETGGEDDVD